MKPLAALVLVFAAAGAQAEEKAEQLVRNTARLDQVKKIAIIPAVAQLRFDRGNGLPDPARMAARITAVTRLSEIVEKKFESRKYAIVPPEAAVLAFKEFKWQPTDLYITNNKGTWESPSEVLRNHKGDEAALLNKREEFKTSPEEMTAYRFKWHDLPETTFGLAAFGLGVLAKPDLAKIKMLGDKTGADALLLCQVADMETHEAPTTLGLLVTGEKFKSTRVHLHFTLISAQDGAIIWQARARGVKSQKTGAFTGERAYNGEDRKAIEGTVQAVDILLSDLFEGTGKTAKQ
jgi:hypothetical protein